MKLYEINAEILRLTDAIEFDEETGEILGDADELFTQIQSLQMEKKSILEYLAKLVLNIRAEAAAAKTEEQQSSYEAQVDYYTTYIQGRDDWEFVSVYADEGITGCNTKKRDGFNSMVEDALAGKIDLIITKSVSRFARNTVDSLTTIRKLKEHGTECYFEKENI